MIIKTTEYTTQELIDAMNAIQILLDLEIDYTCDNHNAIQDTIIFRQDMDNA